MSDGEFYWCLEHHKVEGPHEDKAARRMGPYPTREAAENSGQRPAGGHFGRPGGGSNEDPTHEKTEGAAREAEEGTAAPAANASPAIQ
jgi:hypothetical protein